MTDKRPHRSNLRSNVFAGYFARYTGFLTDGSQKNRSLPHNLLWCQLPQRESFTSRTEILTNSTFCVFTIYLIVLLKMIYAKIVKPSNWFASAQSNSGIHWPLWMCLEDVGPAFMSDNFPALGLIFKSEYWMNVILILTSDFSPSSIFERLVVLTYT